MENGPQEKNRQCDESKEKPFFGLKLSPRAKAIILAEARRLAKKR